MDWTVAIWIQEQNPQLLQVGAGVYLIFNTALMVLIAFWVGVQWNRVNTNTGTIREMQLKIDSHVVPIAEMRTQLNNIEQDVQKLSEAFEMFQKSVFVDAMKTSRERRERHDATT